MKALRFTVAFLLLCSLSLCAFAMDEGYIGDSIKWQSNSEAVYVPLDAERLGESLNDGYYQYYTDIPNNCFYLHISYTESSLNDNGDNAIHLEFNIVNSSKEYPFPVYENTNGKILDNFNIRTHFSEIMGEGQDIYVGIEFLNKEDKKLNQYLNFSLFVNGNKYQICDELIKLAYGDYAESLTTTKPTATKNPTTEKTTAKESTTKQTTTQKETTTKRETTTKFNYTYTPTTQQNIATQPAESERDTTAEKATSPKTESTTKFKYTGASTEAPWEYDQGSATGNGFTESSESPEETAAASDKQKTENGIIIPGANGMAESTLPKKLLTAAAIICAVGGAALITRNALPQKKESNKNSEED